MATKTAPIKKSLTRSIERSNNFDSYLMFQVTKHVHLLSLARLRYLAKMLNKALDKCDVRDAKDPWHYHPDREFYSFSFGTVNQYLKIAENAKEIQRLVKFEKYEAAQQLYDDTERLKLEAKAYVLRG